ncbi:MAG: FtsX-like permease family protein, partial [bacterium]|nr:FtsX-like permease family protein [bacterium]
VFYTYLKLNPDIDDVSLENEINRVLKSNPDQLDDDWTYFLQPVKDIHLRSDLLYEFQPPGNLKYLYIFSVTGVFILMIASVNFINLSTARSTSRAKEVGMRKVIGARRRQLIRQFLGESMMISMIAVITAFFLVWLLLPLSGGLTGIEYFTNDLVNPIVIGGLLILAAVI